MKRNYLIYIILFAVTSLLVGLSIYIFNPKIIKKAEETKTNSVSDIDIFNYKKELNIDVKTNIEDGKLEYLITFTPKDDKNKLSELTGKGKLNIPIIVQEGNKKRNMLSKIDFDTFEKNEDGSFTVKGRYTVENKIIEKVRISDEVIYKVIKINKIKGTYQV